MPRTLGVEEEFHVVDLRTRRLTARAPELLDVLSNSDVAELQPTGVWMFEETTSHSRMKMAHCARFCAVSPRRVW
jgi:gamma-glutamyl:cysteine ligase YbdK (ATP-grasp superfamily)